MAIGDWTEDDVRNGLRTPNGELVGGLNVHDYEKGHKDFKAGIAPPSLTSASYDLGRRRAAENAEAKADIRAMLDRQWDEADKRMESILRGHPEALADYRARMADIRARQKS
ncbi:MAG TPA: hypothetical protein VHY35_17825 [Stellaceae bacterium]|jgi:hypothetical protein|nr:hypothetical protein [Stellaceae bacterium]